MRGKWKWMSMPRQKRLSWPPVTGQKKGQLSCKHHWTTWKTLRETPQPCFLGRRVVGKQKKAQKLKQKSILDPHTLLTAKQNILFVCVCLFLHVFLFRFFLSKNLNIIYWCLNLENELWNIKNSIQLLETTAYLHLNALKQLKLLKS